MEILAFEIPFVVGVPLQYIYGLMMIPLFLIWLFLFYKYPRYRKAMIIGFIVTGTVGHVSQYMMYRHDWFRLLGLFGTDWTPIEDLIIAGTNSGLVFLAWPILTGQNFTEQKKLDISTIAKLVAFWLIMFFIPYYLWNNGVHSYTVEWTVYLVFIVTAYIVRPDLIIKSLVSSAVVTLGTIPFYIAIQFIVENFSTEHYFFEFLSGDTLLNIPIEDYIWYFFVNLLLSVYYHLIFESKFDDSKISIKNSLESIKALFSFKKVV